MRLAITGQYGQVAQALAGICYDRGKTAVFLARPAFDLTVPEGIAAALKAARVDVVVSAAAYTAVDKAESEPDLAFAVNATGAGAVAVAAHALGLPLIHLSTDYVFDGRKPATYVEDDATAPLGVYGASKLAGEHAVIAAHPGAVILRTAWVYSPFGANFVKTMLRLAEARDEVGVVADQIGNPTSAYAIAECVVNVAARLALEKDAPHGIFHMAGSGEASWADLAEAVFVASKARGRPFAGVRRITTADYPTPAPRPANSRLDCGKLAQAFGVTLPAWQGSLEAVVAELIEGARTV